MRQAPRLAERGLPGEEGAVELHLKLLADVGLVGLPNAGKSSLLARITRAQPKVAAYPFTTLEPVLGMLESDDRQLVVADIPGLIEGASGGAGLGHDFLAHVERTRLLVHVLDLAPLDGSDPESNHAVIERELAAHDPRLAALPRMLALSKADLVSPEQAEAAAAEWRERVGEEVPVFVTSSATRQGLDVLARELLRRVPAAEPVAYEAAGEDDVAEFKVFRPAAGRNFEVERTADGGFRVVGDAVDRLIARHDMENDEALALRRAPAAPDGRHRGAGGARVRTRRRRRARRHRLRARSGISALTRTLGFAPAMPVLVVKLGSSVVAQDSGELRLSVVARVCEEVASLHRSGVDVVVVTSGAIARGLHLLERPRPPERDRRAAGGERGRPGAAVPHLRRPADRAGAPDGAGPAHVLRHERAHPLPQRAAHAADAARLARGAR